MIDDTAMRMQMFSQLAKIAHQQNNPGFSSDVLREARKTPVDPNRKGVHSRALFMLASETTYFAGPDALLVMQDAVKQINELSMATDEKVSPLNDPNSFLDSPEMAMAFSRAGKSFLEETLDLTTRIQNQAVRQMARLCSIERILTLRPSETKNKSAEPNQARP